MSEDDLNIDEENDSLHHFLFWLTLIFGAISGASSYFILRFTPILTWYILAPVLYFITYIILFFVVKYRFDGAPQNNKCLFRFSLRYSGTWIIAYFAVATGVFYFGW